MKDISENTSFNQEDQGGMNTAPTQQKASVEKTWDGPLGEQERKAQEQQKDIDQRLADVADKNQGSDNPPLRNEVDPPSAPDIVPDQSPDEIDYPGKQGFPKVEQPQSSDSSIGNEDQRQEGDDEAQETQLQENKTNQEQIKEKEADLREAVEGRDESIRKSEDVNMTDQRGYNEIRENSPVNDEREREFLN